MALEDGFSDFMRRDWETETTTGTVRLAVIGVDHFARQRALPAIADSTRCETTVLVASPPASVADVAETYGSTTWSTPTPSSRGPASMPTTRSTSRHSPLNTIRFLLECESTGVYATTRSEDPPFANVDEHVAFQLEHATGTTASCTASFDAHARSALEVAAYESAETDRRISLE